MNFVFVPRLTERGAYRIAGGARGLPALIGLLLLLAGCAGPSYTAYSDYDESFDFDDIHTIHILPIDRTEPMQRVISDLQVDRIDAALAAELRERGYRLAEERAEADVYLSWHLVTRERTDIRAYNSSSSYSCWRCGPPVTDVSVRQYTEGTFVVDLIDPMRNRSVWRSTIQSRLRAQPDPESARKNRAAAARAVFEQFPPEGS